MFDPAIGKFLSEDPLGMLDDLNAAEYADNDPINNSDPTGLYNSDGHFYTTFIVAVATGKFSADEACNLAYYSQLPDQVKRFDTMHNWFHSSKDDWSRLVVFNWIHSLHGGDLQDIHNRRKCLTTVLRGSMGPLLPWQRGMLVHALGDAYSHTQNIDGVHTAYGWPNGHGFPEGHRLDGHWPDIIGNRPELYKEYVQNLYSALGGTGDAGKTKQIQRLFAVVDHLTVR